VNDNTENEYIIKHIPQIMLGAFLSPFLFGFLGIPFTNDFSGAGIGILVIIAAFILIFIALVDGKHD